MSHDTALDDAHHGTAAIAVTVALWQLRLSRMFTLMAVRVMVIGPVAYRSSYSDRCGCC